ncbi:hypothetical protein Dvar_38930 [Desulfosarcina variabilis str. Montpellier]
MRSPAEMTIIQIELTNACVLSCSNCTRLCGHHKKPFFMEWDLFKKAVDSLKGFNGMAGLMGGEPTLHPEFERFARYLGENYGIKETLKRGRKPIRNFQKYITEEMLSIKNHGRCLCSSLGSGYYKNYEVIQETFHYQLLNDHQHDGKHQGILISRKDLGIDDKEWIPLRDACWLQNNWSASITPKGAFFCEIAAALDILFEGPGGWEIEPGWWERTPDQFGRQLGWCELCGIAIRGPKTCAKDERDDVSPSLLEKLKNSGSPKIAAGKYRIYNPIDIVKERSDYTPGKPFYLPNGDKKERLNNSNRTIFPRDIKGIMILPDEFRINYEDFKNVRDSLDGLLVIHRGKINKEIKSFFKSIDVHSLQEELFNFGSFIKKGIQILEAKDWIAIVAYNCFLSPKFRQDIMTTVFNPGCYYVYYNYPNQKKEEKTNSKEEKSGWNKNETHSFSFLNVRANQLKHTEFETIATHEQMISNWNKGKIFFFKLKDQKQCNTQYSIDDFLNFDDRS